MKYFFTFSFLLVFQFCHSQTLQDSLLAYYPFTGNASDASGNNNHGVVNGAVLTADRFGNANSAYYFDGVDDIVRITNFNNYIVPSESHFSTSLWMKTTTAQNGAMLAYSTACSSLTENYYVIGLSYTNGLSDLFARFMNLNPMPLVADSYMVDGNWHLITYTFDNGTTKLYVDNQLLSTTVVPYPTTNFAYPNFIDWTIGGTHINNCSHGTSYEGVIDEVRIYKRTLTSQDISLLVSGQPSANFVANNQACDLSVSFTNNAANANSYQWDFGDGSTSTQMNPTHTYASSGSYTVTLTAINGSGQAISTQNIQVNNIITAAFTAPSIVYINTPMTFTDNSVGATSWQWDFSNGTISANQNPTVLFTSLGLTDVTLIASFGGNCSDTIIKQVNVRGSVNTLEPFSEQQLKIMPVPVRNNLNISFEFTGSKSLKFELLNVLGQVVLAEDFSNMNNELNAQFDVSQFPVGNYIINIVEYNNQGVIGQLSKKIVIQR